VENPTKFPNTVDILLFLFKKQENKTKWEMINYLLNENGKKK